MGAISFPKLRAEFNRPEEEICPGAQPFGAEDQAPRETLKDPQETIKDSEETP